jgi:hypothetical protein
MKPASLALLCLLSTGCTTLPATQGALPKERATECVANCESLDMKLSAVVVIRNSAGCVCEPKNAPAQPAAQRDAAAAAAGIVSAEDGEHAQANQLK